MAYYVKERTGVSEELREHVAYIALMFGHALTAGLPPIPPGQGEDEG